MAKYQAVILDMFDTLVDFSSRHLPVVVIDGREIRTTSLFIHEVMKPACAGIAPAAFVEAFVTSYRKAEEIRNRSHREVTARERFRILFDLLHIPDSREREGLMEAGLAEHMRHLGRAMEFPESRRGVLERLRARYRLGMISNFDHSPTVETTLRRFGIWDQFETVIVSADTGWRKPRPEIFHAALDRMGIAAGEAIFVGDTPQVDVLGAQHVGMDVIWIDHGREAFPRDLPAPTHTVSSFGEIERLL